VEDSFGIHSGGYLWSLPWRTLLDDTKPLKNTLVEFLYKDAFAQNGEMNFQ
jgi:hypothetical protein